MNLRNRINWFKNNPDLVYLDSAATALKPVDVVNKISEYVDFYSTNTHNTDSNFCFNVIKTTEETRELLGWYLNCDARLISFTPGATFSLNMIAQMLEPYLNEGDEIVLTNAEHSSNLLPWYDLRKRKNIVIHFADGSDFTKTGADHDIINYVNEKTKIVAFANGTNLLGTSLDANKIADKIKSINPNVFVVIDATQYLSHSKMDLKNSKIDFVAGAAHKMMGPTGIGLLYITERLIDKMEPSLLGGGMNDSIERESFTFSQGVKKFELGTPNIMGIYGWNASLKVYKEIALEKEEERIFALKKYCEKQLSQIKGIRIHNPKIDSFLILFSYEGVFSQDLAFYLGTKNIIVRSGLSCAKLANEIIGQNHAVRASMHFYTSEKDIDKLIKVLKEFKKGDELNDII